jgi:single-strand DNA-binding protein
MAQTLNRVTLIGYLGRDPEVRDIAAGQVVNISLATSEIWTDRNGEKREWVEWHQVAIANEKLGNLALERLRKGSRVYVEDQLQTRRWTDDEGIERSATGVVIPKYGGKLIIL